MKDNQTHAIFGVLRGATTVALACAALSLFTGCDEAQPGDRTSDAAYGEDGEYETEGEEEYETESGGEIIAEVRGGGWDGRYRVVTNGGQCEFVIETGYYDGVAYNSWGEKYDVTYQKSLVHGLATAFCGTLYIEQYSNVEGWKRGWESGAGWWQQNKEVVSQAHVPTIRACIDRDLGPSNPCWTLRSSNPWPNG